MRGTYVITAMFLALDALAFHFLVKPLVGKLLFLIRFADVMISRPLGF